MDGFDAGHHRVRQALRARRARKYAWQILHAEMRRRTSDDADEGGEQSDELLNIYLLLKQASDEGADFNDIILELARFGATYALTPPPAGTDPLGVAKEIELRVMTESDEFDDWRDDSRWFKKWAEEHPLLDDEGEGNDGDDQ